jgi:hypothetical protein
METVLARLKDYDKRRGLVLRCYTYRGIKFLPERGWIRVTKEVGDYLRTVRSEPRDPNAPLAFDVCTDDEARALEAAEKREAATRQNATTDIELTPARGERVRERAPDRAADRPATAERAAPAAERAAAPERAAPAAPGAPEGPAPEGSDAANPRDTKTRKDRGG